jgi:hypothetical protein
MIEENTTLNVENSFDFGFSFADEGEVSAPQTSNIEAEHKLKLKDLENMILPLLHNLMKNPEKPYIKWENRVPVIERQIAKIIAITRS